MPKGNCSPDTEQKLTRIIESISKKDHEGKMYIIGVIDGMNANRMIEEERS